MSISSTVEKKQLDIILKLNRLTHEGDIQWEQGSGAEEGGDFYADYKGRRFELIKVYPPDLLVGWRDRSESKKVGYYLYVFGGEDNKPLLNKIPPIPATNDLVHTIYSKQKKHRESIRKEQLQSLEELDEWLSEKA